MKVGFLGLPTTGKTTLFNLLTGSEADTTPFASGKREANLGVVKVPDDRLEKVAVLYDSKRAVPAEIAFVDLAGIPSGDRAGERAEDLIPYIRDADALALVLRDFDSEQAPAPGGRIDPAAELEEIRSDLILADLASVEKKLARLERELKSGDPDKKREHDLFVRAKEWLDGEKLLSDIDLSDDERRLLSCYGFLTSKGLIVLRNFGEDREGAPPAELAEKAAALGAPLVSMNALLEYEVRELPLEERETFYAEFGLEGHGRTHFIRGAFEALDLITFFTGGTKEAHAWQVPRDTRAVVAAGKIHSDMERGFIRAEVIDFETLAEAGGEKEAKAIGKMRLEGKDYIVQDGDVLLIRFSV